MDLFPPLLLLTQKNRDGHGKGRTQARASQGDRQVRATDGLVHAQMNSLQRPKLFKRLHHPWNLYRLNPDKYGGSRKPTVFRSAVRPSTPRHLPRRPLAIIQQIEQMCAGNTSKIKTETAVACLEVIYCGFLPEQICLNIIKNFPVD